MKKGIIVTALILTLFAVSGCNKNSTQQSALVDGNVTNSPQTTQSANSTDAPSSDAQDTTSEQYQLDHFAENADEAVDMDKIEGTEAKTDSSGKKGDGKFTTCDVSIDSVKVSEVEGIRIAFVEYTFKNTSDSDITFTGDVISEAYQDGMSLNAAIFPSDIEGFSPDTISQQVAPGEKIKVQKAFTLLDNSVPIEVYVRDSFSSSADDYLAQVFRLQ